MGFDNARKPSDERYLWVIYLYVYVRNTFSPDVM